MATKGDVTVCIPWRDTSNERAVCFDRVSDFWSHHGFKVVTADSDSGASFNISVARNRAVQAASTDVVIVADADTIPDIANVLDAVDNPLGVIWPYQRYRHIPMECVGAQDIMHVPPVREYRESVGGLFITTCSTYWSVGGMDERFCRGWGFEDNAFYCAASTLSRVSRMPGLVWSFWHDADRDMSQDNPHRARYRLYRAAMGDVEMMRELVST